MSGGTALNSNVGARTSPSTRARTLRIAGILATSILLAGISIVSFAPPPANATSYPSWADVVAARRNAAASRAEVSRIRGLISNLNTRLQSAQSDAAAKGAAAYQAEQTYFAATLKQKNLQAQLGTATAKADKSKQQLGEYIRQLARAGGDDGGLSLNLLLNGEDAGPLLDSLGTLSKSSAREDEIYKQARSERNTVEQLSKLASAQARILDRSRQAAEAASAAAVRAEANVQTALNAQTSHEKSLNLQLAALTTKLTLTEKQYNAGVRAAAIAAAKAAAAAAARARAAGGGGSGGGFVGSSGWALPTIGVITSPYGFRNDPAAGGQWRMHYGDDIADGCLQPIHAAHSGTVSYAGPYGDIGNYILLQNGGQYSTGYGHIANGETFVHIGQSVSAGQTIARTGSTGFSTGCHLYFQVFVGGVPTDPAAFMRARGVILGR